MSPGITPLQVFRTSLILAGAPLLADLAAAQANRISFSIDWQGPTIAAPDGFFGFPITEGDVLTVSTASGAPGFGPLPNPSIALSAGFGPAPGLGLFGGLPCAGHPAGTPCIVEVDALSYGREPSVGPNTPIKHKLRFSVDRFARGVPFSNTPPNVFTEQNCGDGASDVFVDLNLGVGPLFPFTAINVGNTAVVDGNGFVSCSGALYPGVGLVEPAAPLPVPLNPGDNLDALATLNINTANPYPQIGVFFSLDAAYVDPLSGIPHSGSAVANGVTCGDVLHSPAAGGPPVVYAPQFLLGLGLTGAEDDLDALILRENGTPGYQPSQVPHDWVGGTTDMLLFSVRRGSAIIGIPDSIMGLPISEGDILTTPLAGSGNPFPGIYIAAENLGLGTSRSIPGVINDDLDALDLGVAPINDCNGNGVEDSVDIALANSTDINVNGVPDECELLTTPGCFCTAPSPAPCGNFYAPGGCRNSTGVGAILTATGTTSVTNDNLVLTTVQMPINRPGMLVMSPNPNPAVPFWDGLRCFGGPAFRFAFQSTGPAGTWTYGPGLSAYTTGNFPPAGWILPGTTMVFQSWFRDPFGPCGTQANTSNSILAQFTP